MPLTPDGVRAWQRVLFEIVVELTGIFLIVFATLRSQGTDPEILSIVYLAGAGMIGTLPAVRLDEWLNRRTSTGSSTDTPSRRDG